MRTWPAALFLLLAFARPLAAAEAPNLPVEPRDVAPERFGAPALPDLVAPELHPVLPGSPALIAPTYAPVPAELLLATPPFSEPATAVPPPAATPPGQQQAAPADGGGFDANRFGKLPDAAYGAYQRGLYKTAYNLALRRAQNGDPAAQTLVAEILSRGLGVPRQEAEAARWYAAAAEQGVPEAQFQYALMLIDGNHVPKDPQGAFALMQAAAEAGNTLAQFNFAQMILSRETGPDTMAKAISYYERAAEAGLGDAQYAMAQVYINGVGGRPKDDATARRWLVRAARENFDTAQLDLATWLVEGRGGTREFKAGYAWMRRAALAGNVAAQNRLAKLYMQGLGTEPDSQAAAAWYFLARRAGLIDPEMEDFLDGLTDEEMRSALLLANRLR